MKGLTLVALLFAIGTFPAFADIVNGGFEDPNISSSGNYYLTVYSPNADAVCSQTPSVQIITGWTVTGCSVDIVRGPSWAHSGSQGIDLAGTPGPGGVEQ